MKMIHIVIFIINTLNLLANADTSRNFLTHKSKISIENFYEKRESSNGQYSEQRIFNSDLHFDSDFVENSDENQFLNSGVEIINIDSIEEAKDQRSQLLFKKEKEHKSPKEIEFIPKYKSLSLREFSKENNNVTDKDHIFEIFHDKELTIWQLFGIEYLIMLIIGILVILSLLVYKSTVKEKKTQTINLERFMNEKIEKGLEKEDSKKSNYEIENKISQLDLTDRTEQVVFDIRNLNKN